MERRPLDTVRLPPKAPASNRFVCHHPLVQSRAVTGVVGCLLLLLAAPAASPTAAPVAVAASTPLPRVTLISDSVAAAIAFDTGAKAILAEGIDIFLEPGQARRLGGTNPSNGIAPPTALQLIASLGDRLGPTVIMCVGNNDFSDQYAKNMQAALDALRRASVKRVLWVTLHFSDAHYGNRTMNNAIKAGAARQPEVTVVDWDGYARGHPEWFQSDDVHLTGDGPRAMARLFHATLLKLGVPI